MALLNVHPDTMAAARRVFVEDLDYLECPDGLAVNFFGNGVHLCAAGTFEPMALGHDSLGLLVDWNTGWLTDSQDAADLEQAAIALHKRLDWTTPDKPGYLLLVDRLAELAAAHALLPVYAQSETPLWLDDTDSLRALVAKLVQTAKAEQKALLFALHKDAPHTGLAAAARAFRDAHMHYARVQKRRLLSGNVFATEY